MNVFLVISLLPLGLDGVHIQQQTILGSTVKLACPSSTDISWYKGSVLYKYYMVYDRIHMNGSYLTIANIHLSDQEIYKCKSGNEETFFNLTIPALISTDLPYYHRSMKVDYTSKLLIIGSMNSIVTINLKEDTKVNYPLDAKKMSTTINPTDSNVDICVLSHSRIPYCQNHIRILARKSDEIWLTCGTNGDSPTGYEYNATDGSYTSTGNVPCSNNPFHNFTCVLSGSNDSSGTPHMYYGSVYYSDKTIQRPIYNADGSIGSHMKGVQSNNWFKDPEFVGSFELNETVLFFFREDAIDDHPNEPQIYSRIAKVCKKDVGGSTQLRDKWTTFQKVRITCSFPGEYPTYFDILQDVVTKDKQTFYGLFTSSLALADSVICAYNLNDIEQAFTGQFKYQPDATSYWLPVTSVPTPRPGLCIDDSLTLPDPTLEFIANKPMMYTNVTSAPMFVLKQESLQLLEIHRDSDQLVFYTASNRGNVYKLVANDTNTFIERNYSVSDGTFESDIIWAMKQLGNYLYIGTDNTVRAIRIQSSKDPEPKTSIPIISRATLVDTDTISVNWHVPFNTESAPSFVVKHREVDKDWIRTESDVHSRTLNLNPNTCYEIMVCSNSIDGESCPEKSIVISTGYLLWTVTFTVSFVMVTVTITVIISVIVVKLCILIKRLKEENKDLKLKTKALKEENKDLKLKTKALKDENEVLENENARLKMQNKDLVDENRTKILNGDLKKKNKKLKKDKDDLMQEIDVLKQEIDVLKQEIDVLKQEIENLRKQQDDRMSYAECQKSSIKKTDYTERRKEEEKFPGRSCKVGAKNRSITPMPNGDTNTEDNSLVTDKWCYKNTKL